MKTKWVLVSEGHDGGGIFCLGIYDDIHTAIGHAMTEIWDFGSNYKKEGDSFEYSPFEPTEGDAGYVSVVKYKAACWTHIDKPYEDYYFILEHTEEEPNEQN